MKLPGFSRVSTIDPSIRSHVLQAVKEREEDKDIGKGRMQDAVGVITGVGPLKGIGTATATLFAKERARHLYLLDIQDEFLRHLKDWLTENYPKTKITIVVGDCTSASTIEKLLNQVINQESKLDFFFANAGLHHIKPSFPVAVEIDDKTKSLMELKGFLRPVDQVGEEEFAELIRINTMSAFLAIKYASQAMKHICPQKGKVLPGGSIVLTSSIAGSKANAGTLGYSASKVAINSLTQTSAYYLMGKGVRVNAIAPGLIETDMTKPLFTLAKEAGSLDQMGSLNPLQRQGLPIEVAHTALFLASDESSYINGQVIPVDGGLSAGLPYNRSDV
ncbi:hypothetical protein V865_001564 [Kwoniella europaea PYCC6329]|uniref:2,4-dienoyl-CoA reductase n=1 Tax=Kwoniella europaea PYCC6329 TaxID=1423913 RepID=A0AAX4KAV2_9TREE